MNSCEKPFLPVTMTEHSASLWEHERLGPFPYLQHELIHRWSHQLPWDNIACPVMTECACVLHKHKHLNPLEFYFKISSFILGFILLHILPGHGIWHLRLQQTWTRRTAVSLALGSDTMSTHTSPTLTPSHGLQTQDWWAQPLSGAHLYYNPPPTTPATPKPLDTHAHAHPLPPVPKCDIKCHDNPQPFTTLHLDIFHHDPPIHR